MYELKFKKLINFNNIDLYIIGNDKLNLNLTGKER